MDRTKIKQYYIRILLILIIVLQGTAYHMIDIAFNMSQNIIDMNIFGVKQNQMQVYQNGLFMIFLSIFFLMIVLMLILA
jgi:hypothetical protein